MIRVQSGSIVLFSTLALAACGDDASTSTGVGGSESATGGADPSSTSSAGGAGEGGDPSGAGGAGSTSSQGGAGGGNEALTLEVLLAKLRADRDGTLLDVSRTRGWPADVVEGCVVVDTQGFPLVAGDFDGWVGTALTADQGFAYAVVPCNAGARYKLTDATTYEEDPWSRAYDYDAFGAISIVRAAVDDAHLERHFAVGSNAVGPRTVRVWIPAEPATHTLYAHDGQNLFDPNAFFGGWKLQDSAPAGMVIVGIDNTAGRFDEYTHVPDDIGVGMPVGGLADDYAMFVENVVRPLVVGYYGEAPKVGVLGSSLGGLVSLHLGLSNPGGYDFVGSMSGTLGWGSIGPVHTGDTMIERYDAAGVQPFVVFLDSGGAGTTCADADADGIRDDDPNATDNYCETAQLRDVLAADGWIFGQNLVHWHEPGAPHNEAAWASRAFRPLELFASL